MDEISRAELERLYQTLDAGFTGIHERLDLLNGRTRVSEQKIAVLEDRSQNSSDPTARVGAIVGGALGAAGVVWSWFKS